MSIKKITIFFVTILAMHFTKVIAFEYPGAQKEHAMGAQAGARGKADPCAYAGLICSDAYHEAKGEWRIEKRIYDEYSRR